MKFDKDYYIEQKKKIAEKQNTNISELMSSAYKFVSSQEELKERAVEIETREKETNEPKVVKK